MVSNQDKIAAGAPPPHTSSSTWDDPSRDDPVISSSVETVLSTFTSNDSSRDFAVMVDSLGRPQAEKMEGLLKTAAEEAAVLKSLDSRDPIVTGSGVANRILPDLPCDQLKHDFSMSEQADDDERTSSDAPPDAKSQDSHKKQLTVEQALFGLTAALMKVNDIDYSHSGEGPLNKPKGNPVDCGAGATSEDSMETTRRLVHGMIARRRAAQGETNTKGNEDMGSIATVTLENQESLECDDLETGTSAYRSSSRSSSFQHLPYSDKIKREWDLFNHFVQPQQATIAMYCRYIVCYLFLPALGVATLLYHVLGNPLAEGKFFPVGAETLQNHPSISWLLIFICLRQVFILILSKSIELFFVDFLALHTRVMLKCFGPVITLLFVQAKGWPFLFFMWGVLNYFLVAGDSDFDRHWLYWQDWYGLFNDSNPSGDVTNAIWFRKLCLIVSCVGFAVALKRLLMGVVQGRQTFSNYSESLALVMGKMLQVSQVAMLARKVEGKYHDENLKLSPHSEYGTACTRMHTKAMEIIQQVHANEEVGRDSSMEGRNEEKQNINGLKGGQKAKVAELLDRWEEPGRLPTQTDSIPIGAVLQFRRALASMDTQFPFSVSFGLADTRENCIASSQAIYRRLLLGGQSNDGRLHFDAIASLAKKKGGDLDTENVMELIRTFRPERDGTISMVDFVKSVDSVYRELRMLRASIATSSKLDKALNSMFDVIFYVVVVCILLYVTGFDPKALYVSFSSVIVAFAFMIGKASSKYFEGLLFIIFQRPYGIGDRINVSNPQSASDGSGSQGWIVDDVDLFTTTMYLAGTNEKATISNGTLASSRIINCARSPKAVVCLTLKLAVDSPQEAVEVFKTRIEMFVKERPREWLSLLAIRAMKVEVDLGYVEYSLVLQHRESWQNTGLILDSKSTITRFMLELTKKLELRYVSPPVPIMLSHHHGSSAKLSTLSQVAQATTMAGGLHRD